MSNRCTWFLAVIMCVAGTDGPAILRAQETPQQQELWKVSQEWRDAYNRRDLNTFARLTVDDFIGSTDDGIFMSKAGLLKRLSTHPPEADQRKNIRDVRVRVNGDTGVVNYRLSLTEEGFDNGRLIFELRRTEVFQKSNGSWLAIAAHDSLLPITHREPVRADPKTFKDYSGLYEHFRPGFTATYTVEGDHLIDEWKGDKIEAFPMGKDTFFEREDLGSTTFVRDKQGRVTGYVYHYADGQQATGRKLKSGENVEVAAIDTPALGKRNAQPRPVAAAREAGQSTKSNQRTAQRLSSQQKDVWKGEQDSFRYLNAKDLKTYMSMWDANFVGWPDYNDRPVRKADIQSSAVEEFRSSQTPSEPLPAPQPEAVAVFGDVAVTHYFWPEVDQTSPTIYRITHTWQKGRDGWYIIGGMSCPVPRSAVSPSDEKRAVETTIRSFEGAMQEYDFTKADTFYAPEAKWIEGAERTYPELAYPTGQGSFWMGAKANKVQLMQELHDLDIQIRGDVAWVTVINDTTWTANNEEGRKLLAESELEETGRTSPPNQHEWRSSYVESEVLVKMPAGWKIILGHTSLLPRPAEATSGATGSDQSSKSQVVTSTVPPEADLPSTPAPHSVEAEVLELDRAWGRAYVKGDIDVIDRTLAPDWRSWLDTEGSDKATELAEFKAGKNRSLENIIDNARVRVYSNTAVVEARERVRFRDETGEHWLTWHITDVFVKQGGQWRVVASHGSTIPNP